MAEAVGALLALALIWVPGVQISRLLFPPQVNTPLVWGAGYFIGASATAAILFAQDTLLGYLSFALPAVILLGIGFAFRLLTMRRDDRPPGARADRIVLTLISVAVLLLVVPVFTDVWFRPMFPWDAWYSYALQAKVFVYFHRIVDFVPQVQWRRHPNPGVFTTFVGQGMFGPMIQTWMGLGIGRWHESLVNLPWPAAWVSISLMAGGAARWFGHNRRAATLYGLAVLSVPLLSVHAVLAGYLDIWLVAYAALLAILLLVLHRQPGRIGLVLLAAIAAATMCWTKRYGVLFLSEMLAAFLLSLLPARTRWVSAGLLIALCLVVGAYIALSAPGNFSIDAGPLGKMGVVSGAIHLPVVGDFKLVNGQGTGWRMLREAFLSKSFGLMPWLTLLLSIQALARFGNLKESRFLAFWLICILFSTWIAFTYTRVAHYVLTGTLFPRYLLPVILITCVLAVCINGRITLSSATSYREAR